MAAAIVAELLRFPKGQSQNPVRQRHFTQPGRSIQPTTEMSPEMLEFLIELRRYCDGKRGRRASVARTLGISPSALWNCGTWGSLHIPAERVNSDHHQWFRSGFQPIPAGFRPH